MVLKPGDCVRTETGEVGRVVHISRLTVYVAFPVSGEADRIDAFLESQLTRSGPRDCEPDEPRHTS